MNQGRTVVSVIRGCGVFLAAAVLSPVVSVDCQAATQYGKAPLTWADSGGSALWATNSGGTYNQSWTAGNDAVLETTSGTMTMSGVTVHNVTFALNGFVLSGSSVLTLTGSTPTFTVAGNGATLGNNTACILAGTSGFVKDGAGTLTFNPSAVSTLTGGLSVVAGTLALSYTNLATPVDLINSSNTLAINGGVLSLTAKSTGSTTQSFAGTVLSSGGGIIVLNTNGGSAVTLNMGLLTSVTGGVLFAQPSTTWSAQTAPTQEMFKVTGIVRNGTAVSLPVDGSWSPYIGAWLLGGGGGANAAPLQARYNAVDGTFVLAKGPAPAAWVSSGSSPSTFYTAGGATYNQTASESMYGTILNGATINLSNTVLSLNGIVGLSSSVVQPGGGNGAVSIGPENELVLAPQSVGNSLSISAPITDSAPGVPGGVTVLGQSIYAGECYLSGTNTFTGPLAVAAPNILTLSGSGPLGCGDYAGNITINGTVILLPSNVQTLRGNISGYGLLQFGYGETRIDAAAAAISSGLMLKGDGAGVFHYDNSAANGSRSLAVGTLADYTGEYSVKVTGRSGQLSTLTFATRSTILAVAKNYIVGGTGANGTESKIVFTGQNAGFISARDFFNGASYAYYDASGYIRAMNYATDPKCKAISTAVSTFTAAGANTNHVDLGDTGSITAAGSETIYSLRIGSNSPNPVILSGGSTLSFNNPSVALGGGILKAGGNSATISGGVGINTIVSGGGDLIIRCDATNDALTISSPLLSSPSERLVKSGAGTLSISGGSAVPGIIYVDYGALLLHSTHTGAGGVTVYNGGMFGIRGTNGTLSSSTLTVSRGGSLCLGAGAASLTVSNTTAVSLGTIGGNCTLNISATTTNLDRLVSAASTLNVKNTDLVIDTTGISQRWRSVTNAVIIQLTGASPAITGPFRSMTANNDYICSIDTNTAGVVKLALTSTHRLAGGTVLKIY